MTEEYHEQGGASGAECFFGKSRTGKRGRRRPSLLKKALSPVVCENGVGNNEHGEGGLNHVRDDRWPLSLARSWDLGRFLRL